MFMPENCDVLIVGGGPAGLAAGEAAAKQGVRTLILERQHEIGYPIHTSGGTWISDMQALNIPQALYHPINKVVFVSPQREVPLSYHPAVACVVDVRGLYQHLAARAIAAGARLRVRLCVGVIHSDCDDDARIYLDSIIRNVPQLTEKFKDASPIEFHTGLFPSEGPLECFSRDGLLLAGDAGGHGSTLVGEGIRFAIYSGQMAGSVAAEAVKAGNTSAAFLGRFDKQWRARFGRDMDISYMINKRIANYSDEKWDNALDLMKRLTPSQMAQALRGDFSRGLVMGVLARNPGLIATSGKKFLDMMLERINTPAVQMVER